MERADETQQACKELQHKINKMSIKRGELEEKERAMLDVIQRQKEMIVEKEDVATELAKRGKATAGIFRGRQLSGERGGRRSVFEQSRKRWSNEGYSSVGLMVARKEEGSHYWASEGNMFSGVEGHQGGIGSLLHWN